MFKKQVWLAIGLAVAVGASARADNVSTNVTLTNDFTGVGSVANVGEVSSAQAGGLSYTVTTQPLTVPGGAVYATGANLFATYVQVPGAGGGSFNQKGDNFVLTYALQGTQTTAIGSGLSSSIDKGVFAVYNTGTTAFVGTNPATWGPGTAGATLVYSGNLNVNPGNTLVGVSPEGEPSSATPAAGQNLAGFNPVVGDASNGNAVAKDLVNKFFNSPFTSDGVQVHFSETNAQGTTPPSDADLDKNFAAVAALDPTTVFGTTSPFADNSFNTNYAKGTPLTTGDTIQTIAFDTFPILGIPPPPPGVPEPASMLIWAGIAVGFGIYRRTRVKKA